MSPRVHDLVRGLLALVALVALVVGVPFALVVLVGWPLPSSVPSLDQVGDALTHAGVADTTIVKVVACVVWLAWLRLAAGLAVELTALARRRASRPVPVLGGAQRLAASLLSSVTLLAGTVGPVRAAPPVPLAAVVAPALAPSAAAEVAAGGWSFAVTAVAHAPQTRPGSTGPTWRVAPRDTLWGIAERALGGGERWHEIHRLNVGRQVAPGVWYDDGTEVLRTGWTLLLPAGAVEADPGEVPDTVVVERGDTLSDIAAEQYDDAAAWPRIWEANRGRRFGDRPFDDPNLIFAGWRLVLPEHPLPAPAEQSTSPLLPGADGSDLPSMVTPHREATVAWSLPAVDPVPASPVPATTSPSGAGEPAGDVHQAVPSTGAVSPAVDASGANRVVAPDCAAAAGTIARLEPPPLGGASARVLPDAQPPAPQVAVPAWVRPTGISGAVLLATGLAGLLGARRRQRMRAALPGSTLPAPAAELAQADNAVRAASDALALARLDTALRALARAVHQHGHPARVLAVVEQPGGDIVAHLDGRVPGLPGPWTSDPAGARLPAAVTLDALAQAGRGGAAPCPALVHLGDGDDGTRVHVDLEAIGALRLTGDDETAAAIARAVVVSLAVSPLADLVHVVTTEPGAAGFAAEERVHLADDADAAVEAALDLSAGVRGALGQAGAASTFALRAAASAEPWEPTVVVLPGGGDTHHLAPLTAPGGRGVGVIGRGFPGDWALSALEDGRWRLEPLGLDLVPRGLAAAELATLGELLVQASAEPEPAPPLAVVPVEVPELPPWELLVRVLGPVDVVDRNGVTVAFERSKALELVVWLTLHREHPSRVGARTALWDTDVRDATFANVVSDARRSLARGVTAPNGAEWIGRSQGERLPVHELVRTDADLLAAHLARARARDDEGAFAELLAALALVRGMPFAGAPYLWPDGEGTTSNLVLLVTTVAATLAARCLEHDDVDGVFSATATGLRVLPGHEELVCLRMEAHAQRGDLAGVRAEFEGYQRVVLGDPWSDGQIAAKVVATRNRLLREGGVHVSAAAGG